MDKIYLAKIIASDRKKEIDHNLRVRHVLKGANCCDRHLQTGNNRSNKGRWFLKKLFSSFSS